MRKLKALTTHPILFAIFPVLFFYSYNKAELNLGDSSFLLALVVSALTAATLWLILRWILHDSKKSALIVSLLVILFFSYGHVQGLFKEFSFELAGILIGPDKLLLSIWGFFLLGGSFVVLKAKNDWGTLNSFLNVIGIVLIFFSLIDIIPYEIQEAKIVLPSRLTSDDITTENSTEAAELRDIYYLVFDRYGNEETLRKYANFDNSEFISFLEEKGFYVASKSAANYTRTHVSLPSSLNMEHLTVLTEGFDKNWSSAKPLFELIEDNEVMRFLKSRGYKFIHFGDEWAGTWRNRFADLDIHYTGSVGGKFTTALLKTTVYYPIATKILRSNLDDRELKRKRILYKFDRLADMPEIAGPKFIFAHFLIPHDPYVFDQAGKPVDKSENTDENYIENYLNQLVFTNKKIKEVVTEILAKSGQTPIIVIQSDEGPFRIPKDRDAFEPNASLKMRSLILNAYLLPGIKNPGLYPSITPVNSFRVIFNNYFGTDYELLPDEIYRIPNDRLPYQYTNVTDKVMGN